MKQKFNISKLREVEEKGQQHQTEATATGSRVTTDITQQTQNMIPYQSGFDESQIQIRSHSFVQNDRLKPINLAELRQKAKYQININLLDLLKPKNDIPQPTNVEISQTQPKENNALNGLAQKISVAIQKQVNTPALQNLQKPKDFGQYICTNLLDVLRSNPQDKNLEIFPNRQRQDTAQTGNDSFFSQFKKMKSLKHIDSDPMNSSNQEQQSERNDSQQLTNIFQKKMTTSAQVQGYPEGSPQGKQQFINLNMTKSQSINMCGIITTKKLIMAKNNRHSLFMGKSLHGATLTHKNSFLDVVQTSKIEKSVDEEGNQKINEFRILSNLGQGAFGKVKLAENSKGEQFAIKIANKKKMQKKLLSKSPNAFTLLEREIAIMKKYNRLTQINHQNVVKLFEVIDDPDHQKLYLVMEYMGNGSILSKTFFKKRKLDKDHLILEDLNEPSEIEITEEECWDYFRQFLLGLDYLHNTVGVIHRDIKPENLLISERNELKIADFGVSHIMQNDETTISNQTGTQAYLAPEAWASKNFDGKTADIWAGGVTLYQMVYGKVPFSSTSTVQLKSQIMTQEPQYPERLNYPEEAINLLKRLLDKNPNSRIKLDQIFVFILISNKAQIDPWITQNGQAPLINTFSIFEDVTEYEIQRALTKLNFQMALKVATKMLCKARRAKRVVAAKKIAAIQKGNQ